MENKMKNSMHKIFTRKDIRGNSISVSQEVSALKRNYFFITRVCSLLLIAVFGITKPVLAGDNDGKEQIYVSRITGQAATSSTQPLVAGAYVTLDYSGLGQSELFKTIKNIVTFSVIEESPDTIPDFSASVKLRIEFRKNPSSPMSVTEREFTINYNKGQGLKYDAKNYLVFDSAEYVKVIVLDYSITAPSLSNTDPLRKLLAIDNEMRVVRYYNLSNAAQVSNLQGNLTQSDIFNVKWNACAPATGNNYYQLEWVWVENELIGNYLTGSMIDQEKLFRRNATRVDLPYTMVEYNIPFFYDGAGQLYYRIRPVHLSGAGNREDGMWTNGQSQGLAGHNDNLNWQSGTTFAEEGKQNTVVQYYDGLLRNRQTVTKDNTTNTTITAESFYDMEGRPAVQILPVPGADNTGKVIKYTQNLNLFNGQSQNEDPSKYFDLQPIATPNSLTPALSTASGASQYYSPANPDLNADEMNKSIPDAKGYPYTVTRYTPDGTGRIMSQSGVSENMKMGSGHETKYYYGTPAQEELDGLFGTDAGNFTHYFKNMVKDANGQMSVTYTDMQGRTVATALAGDAPNNLLPLDISNPDHYPGQAGANITRNLLDNNVNVIKNNNTIESNTTLLVPALTTYNFEYKLTPESLGLTSCTNTSLCFDCMYDLEFVISDESQETPPIVRKFSNVKLVPDDVCATAPPAFTDLSNSNVSNTINFVQQLPQGSYSVRKTLTMSEATLQFYKDLYLTKGICKTEQQIIDSVKTVLISISGCGNQPALTCQSCLDSLGTPAAFRTNYLLSIGVPDTDHSYDAQITAMYNNEQASCNSLCNNISQTLASKRSIMLGDMIPYTGQYAKPIDSLPPASNTNAYNLFKKYNIFYEVPGAGTAIFRNPWTGNYTPDFYRDDLGAIDQTIHTTPAMLPSVSGPDFVQMFNNDWAEALLPHHPEYYKLKYSETNLTAANNFINTFLQTNDFSQANTNGYLNSTYLSGNTSQQGYDPFYNLPAAATYKTAMNGYLNSNYQGGFSMWQLAFAAAKCQTAPTQAAQSACINLVAGHPVPLTSGGLLDYPYNTLSADEKNTFWQSFRGLYAAERENQVNKYIDDNAQPPAPLLTNESDLLVANGYILRFPKNNTQIAQQSGWNWITWNSSGTPNAPGIPAGTATTPADLYASRCNSYIQSWKAQLLQCQALANHPQRDAIINQIMAGMVEVCKKGSDAANPFGSSNVAPATPNNGQPRSFEEVINQVFAMPQYNIGKDYYCNPYVIEYPKPYGHGPQMYSQVTAAVDSCNCQQFAVVKTAAANAGYNPSNLQSLNLYLQATYGDTITTVMYAGLLHCNEILQTVCNTRDTVIQFDCINVPEEACASIPTYDCEKLMDIIHAYYDDHSNMLLDAAHGSQVFTNLFNEHLGTHYTFSEITAIYQCNCHYQLNSIFLQCEKLAEIINAYYQFLFEQGAPEEGSCRESFVHFFNDYFHVSGYTWEEIAAIYKEKCGHELYLCSKDFNCDMLTEIEHGFSFEQETGCIEAFTEYFNEHVGAHYTWNEITDIYLQVCGHAPGVCGGGRRNSTSLIKGLSKKHSSSREEVSEKCRELQDIVSEFMIRNGNSGDIKECQNNFTDYFNEHFGSNYSWAEIVDIYIKECGTAPNVCGANESENCRRLQEIVTAYINENGAGSNGDIKACRERFTAYFNDHFGAALTWDEIMELYIKECGIQPNICSEGESEDCRKLQDIVTAFLNAYGPEINGDVKECRTKFTDYFNSYFGTAYTWDEIMELYIKACGTPPNICGATGIPGDCKELENIVAQYINEYGTGSNGDVDACRRRFVAYFNAHFGTVYTWDQIIEFYIKACGTPPNICNEEGGWSCRELQDIVTQYINDGNSAGGEVSVCRQKFVDYFNAHFGTAYTWDQIVELYIKACGTPPDICNGSGTEACVRLQEIAHEFVNQYGHTTDNVNECHTTFENYFNSVYGSSYTWDQIVALYIENCGAAPDVCKCEIHTTINECHTVYQPYPLGSPQPLPAFLTCGFSTNHCISCAQLSAFTAEFKSTFATPHNVAPLNGTNFTDDEVKSHILFANFLNYRTGFQFNWIEYVQAATAANCNVFTNYASNQTALQNVICGDSHPVTDTTHVPVDPCQHTIDMAITIGQQIYQNMVQTQLAAFEAQYRAKCMSVKDLEQFTVQYLNKEYHYTLYYYDVSGNLVKTVPPKGVRPDFSVAFTNGVKSARTAGATVIPAHTFATNYRYNGFNQVTAQNTPDAGTSSFWYDRLGRIVVSQNAQQKIENKYSYTLFDNLGRITEAGQKPQTIPMSQAISQDVAALEDWALNAGGVREQIVNTVYDEAYPALATSTPVLTQKNLRNRVSYVTNRNFATDADIISGSYYTYDIHGNVDTLVQDYAGIPDLNNSGQRFKTIAYDYDLLSGKVNEVSYQPGKPDAFYHHYYYDAGNRITSVATSRDKIVWDRDAKYNYYKHGPLARTELGQLRVQGMDYAYTTQGWLKGINSTNLLQANDIGLDGTFNSAVAKDALGFALHYFDTQQNGSSYVDYTSIGGLNTFAKPMASMNMMSLFNGNIAGMTVNNSGLQLNNNASQAEAGKPLFYNYRYDQLNRIKSLQVHKNLDIAANQWLNPAAINDYAESTSYDPNGNILTYNRNGAPAAGMPLNMDDMTYEYYGSTNKLAQVRDAVASANYPADIDNQASASNYKYDAIGNLISDDAEGITNIKWTVYGKIASIAKADGSVIDYLYDAAGNRITKTVNGNVTAYVRDAQGNVISVYEAAGSEPIQTEVHLYGSSRLGMITKKEGKTLDVEMSPEIGRGTINTFTRGERIFELSNHLGNVMATVSDKKTGVDEGTYDATGALVNNTPDGQTDYYKADILSANDYYPFGMQMPGRSFAVNNSYRYGFNGKENDKETKTQDYGLRIYKPGLGKFLSVDPLTKSYPELTPYQFASNKPINGVDLDGAEWVLKIYDPQALSDFVKALDAQDIYKQREITYSAINTTLDIDTYVEHRKNNPKYDNNESSLNLLDGLSFHAGELIYDGNAPEGVNLSYAYYTDQGTQGTIRWNWPKSSADQNHDLFYPVDVRTVNSPEFTDFYGENDVILKYMNYYGSVSKKNTSQVGYSESYGYMRGYGYVQYTSELIGVSKGAGIIGREIGMMTGKMNWPDVTSISPSTLEGAGISYGYGVGLFSKGSWGSFSNSTDAMRANMSKATVFGNYSSLSATLGGKGNFSGSYIFSDAKLNSYFKDKSGTLKCNTPPTKLSFGN
jgi:RHS repeat-associated protein